MDVRQLLLLAVDNSKVAKKRADRLDDDSDDDDEALSSDAVSAYLAKKKKIQAKIKLQEDEAKKKRIEARLNASLRLTKKEKEEKVIKKAEEGRFLPGDIRYEKAQKAKEKELKQKQKEDEERRKEKEFKEKLRRKQEEKRRVEEEEEERFKKHKKEKKRRSISPEDVPAKKKLKEGKNPKSSVKDNTHRKEKKYKGKDVFESSITYSSVVEKEKAAREAKEKDFGKKKTSKQSSSGMSFVDLMKIAKTNAVTTKLDEKGHLLKKKEKPKTFEEEHGSNSKHKDSKISKRFREERENETTKTKTKAEGKDEKNRHRDEKDYKIKETIKNDNHKLKEKEYKTKEAIKDNHKLKDSSHSSKHHQSNSKNKSHYKEHAMDDRKSSKGKESIKENRPKSGLITETISTKKIGSVQPSSKITKSFKQVKPKLNGIEAQMMRGMKPQKEEIQKKKNKMPKKGADDYEDELEREMKELARKRKMFEQRGTVDVPDDEYYDSAEEYDLSDDDDYDDDFIDDTEDAPDVSKAIRKITGYDKRIYDDSDEDTGNMESTFGQIEKEEARSARIAREEDRIEALKEAEELAREAAAQKKHDNLKKKKR